MKNKKWFTLLLCMMLVLSAAVPGTFAIENGTESDTACTCGVENEEHSADCPLYVPDPSESEPTDTSNFDDESEFAPDVEKDNESDKSVEPDTAVLPTFTHNDGCDDECFDRECACPCHEMLFKRMMSAETYEEMLTIAESATEEEIATVTEDQLALLEARLNALEPEPIPAVEIPESEPPRPGEIVYPSVNFTDVAPFGDPVVGSEG